MPGAPQAKFEFVATGDAAVNAQIEGVVNKLVRMKQQARDTQQGMTDGVEKTRATIHLLNDDLELHLPRALQTVLAKIPAVQTAFAGLLGGAAVAVGGKVLFDVISGVVDKVREYREEQEKAKDATVIFGTAVTNTFNSLRDKLLEAQIKADELRHDHFAALKDQLELIDHQTFNDLMQNLEKLGKAADDAFGKLKSHWYEFSIGSAGAQHSLTEFKVQYDSLIAQGKGTEASDLLTGTLASAQRILQLQKEAMAVKNGADHRTFPIEDILELQAKAGILNVTKETLQAQETLVNTLQAQVGVEQRLNSLKDIQSKNAKAETNKTVQGESAEIQGILQKSNDNSAAAIAKAAEELIVDPLDKAQQKVTDVWNKVINDYERGQAELIKQLKAKGIDTTAIVAQTNATVLQLLAARAKAEADQARKNQIDRLTASGSIKGGPLPSFLFVSYEQKAQQQEADYLIKQINDDLAAEAAKEAELKDKAQSTGDTQIDLETQLRDLRVSTADKTKLLVDQLMELAKGMHAAFGDPIIEAQAKKLESRLESLRTKTKSWQLELKQTLKNDFQDAFVGIVSGTETVSQAFQHMAQSILAELAKIIFQMYILKLVQGALGGLFGGGGGGGGGNVVDISGIVNAPSVLPHAAGGPVMSGMTYLIGERGPELLTVGASGYITPNNQIGGAMGKAPIVNIHNYGPPMDQQQTSHFDGEQFVIDVVVKNIDNNGAIRQKLR